MPTIYGYVRVSIAGQAESGLSLQDQRTVIASRSEALAIEKGIETGEIFTDPAVSATRHSLRDRPAGGRLDRRRDGLYWRQIADRLNEKGVERPGGFPGQRIDKWTPQAVSRLHKALIAHWP
jgi:hypothetical protein